MDEQPELDFAGVDADLQRRLREAANISAFRQECARVNTPEMLTISWIHGWRRVTDDDLRWWNHLPGYRRKNKIDLFEETRRLYDRDPLPLYCKMPDFWDTWHAWWDGIQQAVDRDEESVDRMADEIRKAFVEHRPCPWDISSLKGYHYEWARYLLDRAVRRAGVPLTSLPSV